MRPALIVCVLWLAALWLSAAQTEEPDDEILISAYYYTYHQGTGNRFISGRGTFPNVNSLSLPLAGSPLWVVGAAFDLENVANPVWVVALASGDLQGTFIGPDGQLSISPVIPELLPPQMPPVLTLNPIGAFPQQNFPADLSPLTHVVFTDTRSLYVTEGGGAVILLDEVGAEMIRLPLRPLPDARIAINNTQTQAALYIGATDERYVHDVLGDALEATALMVINLDDGNVPVIIELPGTEVFESIMPIWADVNDDGTEDLLTTVSAPGVGAQIRVYNAADGMLIAAGPAVGQGQRWRHALAWAAFGPNGESQLVEVLTPHIGGVVGFYEYDGMGALNIVAQLPGYTSHVIGSRNLDMAVAGDFDGDGQPEIILPDQARGRIAGLSHAVTGQIQEVWSLPIEDTLVTNLAAVQLPDGRLALAAGVEDVNGFPRLQVWLP